MTKNSIKFNYTTFFFSFARRPRKLLIADTHCNITHSQKKLTAEYYSGKDSASSAYSTAV